MKTTQLGTLRARIAGGTDREGGGDGPVVVLLHGFGAPGTDLCDLWRVLPVAREVRFVFPEAPLLLGPGYGDGRAWWMLDLEAMERRARGEHIDRAGSVPKGLPEARAAMLGLLDAVQTELTCAPEQIVLGGFSQGSMLALDVALHCTLPLAGLVLWSTTLVAQSEWQPRMAARAGLPVLQSHGQQDPLLPFADAERLRDLLAQAGVDVTFLPFRGGHEIPPQVLQATAELIARVLT